MAAPVPLSPPRDGRKPPAQVVADYWADTVEHPEQLTRGAHGDEGDENDPGRFTFIESAVRLSMRTADPSVLGTVRQALFGGGKATAVTSEALSTLMVCTLGVSRFDLGEIQGWPVHRYTPTARCFAPTELYVDLPRRVGGWPAGTYHFDPAHEHLVLIRSHMPSSTSETSRTPVRFILTSAIWKTAFRYRHYAYRLCMQEAGIVSGHLRMVVQALGYRASTYFTIDDESLASQLDVDLSLESPIAVIDVDLPIGGVSPRSSEISPGRPVATRATVPPATSLASRAYEMMAASRSAVHPGLGQLVLERGGTTIPALDGLPDVSFAEALRMRTSGGSVFRVRPPSQPLPVGYWADALHALIGRSEYAHRFSAVFASTPRNGGSVRVDAVGWKPLSSELTLERTREIVSTAPIADAVNLDGIVYLNVRRDLFDEDSGDLGYRLSHVAAGELAAQVCVLAAAAGRSARIVNAYSAARVREMFELNRHETALFQVFLGRRSHGGQYEVGV
jgi:SagB-type dehydrogenase family enzyme